MFYQELKKAIYILCKLDTAHTYNQTLKQKTKQVLFGILQHDTLRNILYNRHKWVSYIRNLKPILI